MKNPPPIPTAATLCYQIVSCLQLSPLRITLSLITAAFALVGENTQLSSWSRGAITTLPFPFCRWTNICQSSTVKHTKAYGFVHGLCYYPNSHCKKNYFLLSSICWEVSLKKVSVCTHLSKTSSECQNFANPQLNETWLPWSSDFQPGISLNNI